MTLDSWTSRNLIPCWWLFEGAMVYIRHHVDTWWHHGWSPLALQSMQDRSGNASWAAFNASLLFPPVTRKVFIWAEYSLFNIVISSFIFASHRSTLLPTTPAQTKKHLISTSLVQLLARRARILLAILLLPSSWTREILPIHREMGESKAWGKNQNHHPHPRKKNKKTWAAFRVIICI